MDGGNTRYEKMQIKELNFVAIAASNATEISGVGNRSQCEVWVTDQRNKERYRPHCLF
jgi:hypothetical protein